MAGPVRDSQRMIREMAPRRRPGRWIFASLPEADPRAPALAARALAAMREPEGLSVVISTEEARRRGLNAHGPVMAHLMLGVHSALDGTGLTAAVSETLAAAGIPCNIVAGCRHDHLFIPEARADEALALLRARAERDG